MSGYADTGTLVASSPLISALSLTLSIPILFSIFDRMYPGINPSAAHTSAPVACPKKLIVMALPATIDGDPNANIPAAINDQKPLTPCTATTPTGSSIPLLASQSSIGLSIPPPANPITNASGGHHRSSPAPHDIIPASAPDSIQNGSRVTSHAPITPPENPISTLNEIAERVMGVP